VCGAIYMLNSDQLKDYWGKLNDLLKLKDEQDFFSEYYTNTELDTPILYYIMSP